MNFHLIPRTRVTWYALALVLAVLGTLAALVPRAIGDPAPVWALLTLGLFALAAEKQPVRVSTNVQMTVAILPILFAATVYGPVPAMCVTGISLLGDLGRPFVRWMVWTSHRCLTAAAMGVVAQFLLADDRAFMSVAAAVTAAAVVEAFGDVFFGALTVMIRRSASPSSLVRTMLPLAAATIPLHAPFVTLLVYMQAQFTIWTLLLFIAPALAAQSLYRLYWRERSAREGLDASHRALEKAHLSFAQALVSALDARDAYTAGHSAAVAIYARDLAAEMGLCRADQELAQLAGLLHDIGKVGLPPGIIEKNGPLSDAERRQMQEHSEIGARILGNVEGYQEVALVVLHHHERIDGCGYPSRITRDRIPLISRIIAVVDAYNAMTSGRSYRGALSPDVAIARLREAAGSQFDPQIVETFALLLQRAPDVYREGLEVSPDASVHASRVISVPVMSAP